MIKNKTYIEIPLYNKNGITEYSKIDEINSKNINAYRWNLNKNNYAINSKVGLMHRFIMNAQKGDIVDHVNQDKLDNRIINLRIVSRSQNMQNRNKFCGEFTSKFKGVSKKNNNWVCILTTKEKKHHFTFENEEHAAYWYDQLSLKFYGMEAKINNVIRPIDFREPVKNEKDLPTGVTYAYGKYRAFYAHKYLGLFDTIEDAESQYNITKQKQKLEQLNKKIGSEIERNNEGIATIKTSNEEEILVDDDKYFDLKKYTWLLINNYACAKINNKLIRMHRYLFNLKNNEIIDHINHNTIDNRISNLRISDEVLNGHNRTKKKEATSKYIGVCLMKKTGKYMSYIVKDKKRYHLGYFNKEEDAANAYNKKAIELYGEHANLN